MKSLILHPLRLRAALDGRLTVMRVPIVPQPPRGIYNVCKDMWVTCEENGHSHGPFIPPYAHGEVRFVREAWEYGGNPYLYKIDDPSASEKWRPARTMQYIHARLTITFLNPRPERVQDVTEEDCVNEGAEWCSNPDHGFIDALGFTDIGRVGCPVCGHDPGGFVKNNFKKDWDTIYPRYPWAENPWVWRYETERSGGCDE